MTQFIQNNLINKGFNLGHCLSFKTKVEVTSSPSDLPKYKYECQCIRCGLFGYYDLPMLITASNSDVFSAGNISGFLFSLICAYPYYVDANVYLDL